MAEHRHLVASIHISCESIGAKDRLRGSMVMALPAASLESIQQETERKKSITQELADRCKVFWLTNARIRHVRNKDTAAAGLEKSPPPMRNLRLRISTIKHGKNK